MQPNKVMYIDLLDPLPKSYAPKKGEEMNRSTYSTMRYTKPFLKISQTQKITAGNKLGLD